MRLFFRVLPRLRRVNARSATTLASVLAAVVMTLALIGCGKEHVDHAALYPAEGQVLWKKEPLAGALVVLYPQGQSDAKAVPSRAQTGPDGRFRVSTFGTADGAPEGEYAVTVVLYPLQKQGDGWVSGRNALPAKYASPQTTDLRVQIAPGKKTLPPLVLQPPGGNSRVSSNVSLR